MKRAARQKRIDDGEEPPAEDVPANLEENKDVPVEGGEENGEEGADKLPKEDVETESDADWNEIEIKNKLRDFRETT